MLALECYKAITAVVLRVAVAPDPEQPHVQQRERGRQDPFPGQAPAAELLADRIAGRRKACRERQDVVILLAIQAGGTTSRYGAAAA